MFLKKYIPYQGKVRDVYNYNKHLSGDSTINICKLPDTFLRKSEGIDLLFVQLYVSLFLCFFLLETSHYNKAMLDKYEFGIVPKVSIGKMSKKSIEETPTHYFSRVSQIMIIYFDRLYSTRMISINFYCSDGDLVIMKKMINREWFNIIEGCQPSCVSIMPYS